MVATTGSKLMVEVRLALGDKGATPEQVTDKVAEINTSIFHADAKVAKTKQQLLAIDMKLAGQVAQEIEDYKARAKAMQDVIVASQKRVDDIININKEQIKIMEDDLNKLATKYVAMKTEWSQTAHVRALEEKMLADMKVKSDLLMATAEKTDIEIDGMKAKVQETTDTLKRENDAIEAKTEKLGIAIEANAAKVEDAKSKGQNWWYVINGLMHLADRLMDKSKSDWSRYFGIVISIITNTVTSMHAISVGLAASGPVGMIQAGIIVTSNLMSTTSVIQVEAQRQALDSNKNNIGDTMFG